MNNMEQRFVAVRVYQALVGGLGQALEDVIAEAVVDADRWFTAHRNGRTVSPNIADYMVAIDAAVSLEIERRTEAGLAEARSAIGIGRLTEVAS